MRVRLAAISFSLWASFRPCGSRICIRTFLPRGATGAVALAAALYSGPVLGAAGGHGLADDAAGDVLEDEQAWESLERASGGEQFDGVDAGEVDFTGKVDALEFDISKSFDENIDLHNAKSSVGPELGSKSSQAFVLAEFCETKQELDDFVSVPEDEQDIGGGVIGLFQTDSSRQPVAHGAWLAFVELSNELAAKGLRFAYATDPELLDYYHVKQWRISVHRPPALVDLRGGEELSITFPGSDREASAGLGSGEAARAPLAEFLVRSALPRVGHVTYENEDLYDGSQSAVVVVYFDSSLFGQGISAQWSITDKIAKQVATLSRQDGSFQVPLYAIADVSQDIYELRYFSAELVFSKEQILARAFQVAVRKSRGEYYRWKGEDDSAESIASFILSALKGKEKLIKLEGQYYQAAQGGTVLEPEGGFQEEENNGQDLDLEQGRHMEL